MNTNLPTQSTTTQQAFNSLVINNVKVNPDVYEQLINFFKNRTSSESAAKVLAQSVITLTYENDLDPLKILKEFDIAANDSELKILLIAFFNGLRPSTSKLGFTNTKVTNQWVRRNILP